MSFAFPWLLLLLPVPILLYFVRRRLTRRMETAAQWSRLEPRPRATLKTRVAPFNSNSAWPSRRSASRASGGRHRRLTGR